MPVASGFRHRKNDGKKPSDNDSRSSQILRNADEGNHAEDKFWIYDKSSIQNRKNRQQHRLFEDNFQVGRKKIRRKHEALHLRRRKARSRSLELLQSARFFDRRRLRNDRSKPDDNIPPPRQRQSRMRRHGTRERNGQNR